MVYKMRDRTAVKALRSGSERNMLWPCRRDRNPEEPLTNQ